MGYGGFLSLMGPVTAEAFGQRHLGVNFGIMFLTVAEAAYAGPRLAAQVAEADGGGFSRAFVITTDRDAKASPSPSSIVAHLLLRRRREAVAALEPAAHALSTIRNAIGAGGPRGRRRRCLLRTR